VHDLHRRRRWRQETKTFSHRLIGIITLQPGVRDADRRQIVRAQQRQRTEHVLMF
jgi:hypothetical protein